MKGHYFKCVVPPIIDHAQLLLKESMQSLEFACPWYPVGEMGSMTVKVHLVRKLASCLKTFELVTLIHALGISRLFYCKLPYLGSSLKTIWKPQLDENTAAQPLSVVSWRNHTIPLLRPFHWLPISFWDWFKMVITFKALQELWSTYLNDRFSLCVYVWQLCSSYQGLLFAPPSVIALSSMVPPQLGFFFSGCPIVLECSPKVGRGFYPHRCL